jgi:hypothetical protein
VPGGRQADGDAVLAEGATLAHRAGAGAVQLAGRLEVERHVVRRCASHRGGSAIVLDGQAVHATLDRVLLAALERARAGERAQTLR